VGRRRGVTLIELLVVLGIISVLLGIGVGAYFGFIRTTALQGETRRVMAVIQMARSTAVSEGAETFVAVDASRNQLYPFARRHVGVWHFETLDTSGAKPRSVGAFGYAAVTGAGSPTLADGKVGKAIAFDGSTALLCKRWHRGRDRNIGEFDTREGVGIEAWIAPSDDAATQTIVHRDGWFELWLDWDDAAKKFALHGRAWTYDAESGNMEGGRLVHSNPVIHSNAWTHVTLNCHRLDVYPKLTVNGRPADHNSTDDPSEHVPDADAETAIGAEADGTNAFHGRIDEVLVSAYLVDRVQQVTQKLKLGHDGLAAGNTIRFDRTGRLGPEHEGTVPRLYLREYDRSKEISRVTITVGEMGTLDVDVWHE
jgi:prepilin-type N-terminal cleavage/methylation domain-containing protein